MSRLTCRSHLVQFCSFALLLAFGPGSTTLLPQSDVSVPREVMPYLYVDMILYNGKVLTVDDKFTVGEAVAVRDGKTLAVGSSALIQKMAGPNTVRIDLQGGTLTPGFIDSHANGTQGWHGPSGPSFMKNYKSISCLDTGTQKEDFDGCLRKIKDWVDKAPAGEWIFVSLNRTAAAYKFTMPMLDSISGDHPLLCNLGNTAGIVNSKAFAMLNDYMSDEYVQSGIFRDKDGKPTGMIAGASYGVMSYEVMPWPTGQWLEEMIQKEILREKFINRMGVTSLGSRMSGLSVQIAREIQNRGIRPLRIRASMELMRLNPRTEQYLRRTGNLMDVGDEWFKIGGATVSSMDGAQAHNTRKPAREIAAWDAFGPYGMTKWKDMVTPDKDWKKYSDYDNALIAGRYGWNVNDLHIQGDAGLEVLLEIMDKINETNPVKGKHYGTVHGLFRPPDLAKRLAAYDAVMSFSSQYIMRGNGAENLAKRFGADEVAGMSPIRDLIDVGLKPVMEVNNTAGFLRGRKPGYGKYLDSQNLFLDSMELFVTRKNNQTGKVWGPNQRVTREEVLKMATSWASRFYGDEKIMGRIEPGKLADYVVLGGDYMTAPEEQISDLPILKVIVGGKVTYDRARDEAWYLETLKQLSGTLDPNEQP
ncbi:MAG: amidohydrolase family protein, partial [Acidobacteria bacterium]|nr:amidohydrolase family protein [Acidobacteriota bacterium]